MPGPSHDNGSAPADLAALLGARDKSPQEVLGDVTRTDLPRNVALAAAVTFGAMVLLTVGPYAYNRIAAKPADKAETAAQESPAPATPAPQQSATKIPAAVTPDPLAAGAETAKTPAAPDSVLDKLNVGETKTTDPKKNPLEKVNDDLLKDIK